MILAIAGQHFTTQNGELIVVAILFFAGLRWLTKGSG
jgi:hypothetical protein